MPRKMRPKRVDVRKDIDLFRPGDFVKHKMGDFEHGVVLETEHAPIFRNGFIRLDHHELLVRVKMDYDEIAVYNANDLTFDPLEQLAREGDEEAI
jgi:hypothetical protein